jgi:hypothetical protein
MTLKEKAQQLVDKFELIQSRIEWTDDNSDVNNECKKFNSENNKEVAFYWKELAKKSACLAIDEIIDADRNRPFKEVRHYLELKQAIKDL